MFWLKYSCMDFSPPITAARSKGNSRHESLSFRDRFDILLEKRPGGVARLKYTMVYGKCQVNNIKKGITVVS